MTRRRAFSKVMDSLEVAKKLRDTKGLKVKINCVVIKGESLSCYSPVPPRESLAYDVLFATVLPRLERYGSA
jgi:hypothetical protein